METKLFEMSYFCSPITNKVPLTTLSLMEVAAIISSRELEPQKMCIRDRVKGI